MLTNFATKTRASLRNFRKNNKGVTAIEYGLIAVVMAAFIVYAFSSDTSFVQKLKGKFDAVTESVQAAGPDAKPSEDKKDEG
ncbi:Flp family type IVb pilin [Bisgaard Taxon 10/6]|uniref:Flp family type IVb pilin n=1 Tax=Exercitatus varius TaxID=67857 RepID=UPI00294B0911|nr:Flp family type IVb pilin [Exercitatus varius]MDG2955117.1 Flp family type IVb pilin [Exercitatus varius]